MSEWVELMRVVFTDLKYLCSANYLTAIHINLYY